MSRQFVEYHSYYSNDTLRGVDITQRPLLAADFAKQYAAPHKSLLDIGCGNMHKTLPLSDHFSKVVGVDPSRQLIEQAQSNIKKQNRINARILEGTAQSLPPLPGKFDVVTAILTFWEPSEIHQIIHPEGVLLIEALGPEDKIEFTRFFGQDAQGWRGANIGLSFDMMVKKFKERLSPYFEINYIHNQNWQTRYSTEGLWTLLNNTYSTVRNFDPLSDKAAFEKACLALSKDEKIILNQNRLIIEAKPIC